MSLLIFIGFFLAYGKCYNTATLFDPRVNHVEIEREPSSDQRDFSNRVPLLLTPYVQKGETAKGQEASKVVGLLGNVESYSGYFTVNKTNNRNLFFWYFPAEVQPANSPVLLWLQGGPGGSSMYGLSQENGPFHLNDSGSVIPNPYSWTKNHHVIYIDSPAGVGFSFPDPTSPFGEDEIGADLYTALEQFFQLFSHIANNDFYVAGESYGGWYVPSAAIAIHKNNPKGRVKIKLKGLMIGNGLIRDNCFSINNQEYDDFLTQNGLPVGFNRRKVNPYNYLENGDGLSCPSMDSFFNQAHVQQNIHVGEVRYNMFNDHVSGMVLDGDAGFNVVPIVEELLQHYPILYYYGQLDTVCPYPPSAARIYRLHWNGYSNFQRAKRRDWKVGDDLAGYIKSGGNLSLALVRNAGHMVPMDQPVWSLDLIKKFISNKLGL